MKSIQRASDYMRLIISGLFAAFVTASAFAQPLGTVYSTEYRYDLASRLVGVIKQDPDLAGPLQRPAERRTYNAQGLLATIESGAIDNLPSESVAPATWTGFSVLQQIDFVYDIWGRKTQERVSSGGAVYTLTQYSYDAMGRVECTATRMNPAAYSSLPGSACTLGAEGSLGPDRITRHTYDVTGRPLQSQRGYGTSQQINYATYTYSTAFNGRGPLESETDANGNKTLYAYDGLVRRTHWYFPSPNVAGSHNPSDFEQYSYDNNGKRISLRKRDGRTIWYVYDALGRLRSELYPSGSLPSVTYTYDLRNLQLTAVDANGVSLSTTYDGFGRQTSSTTNQSGAPRTLSYLYDAEGNRVRVTHPDGQYFSYEHDALNRLHRIRENGASQLITITYDALNRGPKTFMARGDWIAGTSYGYDPISRLNSINHNFAGTADDEIRSFSHNPANQIVSRTLNNAAYVFAETANAATFYTVNGLNQYTQLWSGSSVNPTHDVNGNMTWDGSTSYAYDILNRLTSTSGARTLNLTYDPKGRLFQTSGGPSGTTQFLYDGDALVAEYNSAGVITKRYIHGAGVDEPLVWYDGSSVGQASRRYLYADHQGSVSASVDASGAALSRNTYDPYGVPASTNAGRFQYTGQILLPDLGLYHYKARAYNPTLGRFMQTDPVGYKDDMDLYTYVGDDPMNKNDPTGAVIDTLFDIASIVYDVYAIATEGATRTNVAALGADIAGALIPGATGLGSTVRALDKAHDLGTAARASNAASDVAKGETAATKAGRQAHKDWDPGAGYQKEVRLDNGKRADAVNFEKREVVELKPDNPRAVARGEKQVEGYRQQLERQSPTKPGQQPWTCRVETYCRK